MYHAVNSAIYYKCSNGESDFVAVAPPLQMGKALDLLNRAAHAQDRHRYTESARLYAKAEQLPGFGWVSDSNDAESDGYNDGVARSALETL